MDDNVRLTPHTTSMTLPMAGFSRAIKRTLSAMSVFTVCHILPSAGCFTKGMRINSSMIAEVVKQAAHIANTVFSPYTLYRIPPRAGPARAARDAIILMTELACISCSGSTRAGTLACTAGWYAPAIP